MTELLDSILEEEAPEQNGNLADLRAEIEKLSYWELLDLLAAQAGILEGAEPSECKSPFTQTPATTYVASGEDHAHRPMRVITYLYSPTDYDQVRLFERGQSGELPHLEADATRWNGQTQRPLDKHHAAMCDVLVSLANARPVQPEAELL